MKKSKGVGVVVGRFQVPELHEAHKQIINTAKLNHGGKYIVFIACTVVKGSDKDPLDYATRHAMVKYEFPDAIILPILDCPCDREWSRVLDGEVIKYVGRRPVTLYSGHDGFGKYYKGRFKVKNFPQINFYRGTEIREVAGKVLPQTKEARLGVIYGITSQYPRIYSTVDIAILKEETVENGGGSDVMVLLGRKRNLPGLRFPGGFVDQSDNSLEEAARREVGEECGGIETEDYEYITSMKVDDWRYRNRPEKIMTTFFKCKYTFGSYLDAYKVPDAEFEHIGFYPVNLATKALMADTHLQLFVKLNQNIKKHV